MIKVNLQGLEQSLKLKLEKKGFTYVKTRSLQIQEELQNLGMLWLRYGRGLLSRTADPHTPSTGLYPRSYKWYKGEHNPNPDKGHHLIDSLFYSVRRRINKKSVTITAQRGFHEDYNIWHGIDYGNKLNNWTGKPFAGYQERITEVFDKRVRELLLKRSFR